MAGKGLIRQHLIRDLKEMEGETREYLEKEHFRKKKMEYLKALNWDHTGDLNEQQGDVNVKMGRKERAEVRGRWRTDYSFTGYRKNHIFIPNRWESQ